jgi:peptide deformylase
MPHPALKAVCGELEPDEQDRAHSVAADLLDTMAAHAGCVGLAAPQLGELVRAWRSPSRSTRRPPPATAN